MRQGFMRFSWIHPDNSSQYSSITLILGSVRQQAPFLLNPMPQLPAPSIVPLVSGKLWDPDVERTAPSWKILLVAGKQGGWEERALSHLVVFIPAFSFFFCSCLVLVLFLWFRVTWRGTKGEEMGKQWRGVRVTEAQSHAPLSPALEGPYLTSPGSIWLIYFISPSNLSVSAELSICLVVLIPTVL